MNWKTSFRSIYDDGAPEPADLVLAPMEMALSRKKPGWNNLLLPRDEQSSQLVPELAPVSDEIVVTKTTTDSALTGANLRLVLSKMKATMGLSWRTVVRQDRMNCTVRSLRSST